MAVVAATEDVAPFLLELGLVVSVLAVLARAAGALRLSAIPLYLLAGLALGRGGLVPLGFSETFVAAAADLGVVLLLFTLGLEFTGDDLRAALARGRAAAGADILVNAVPGFAAGLLLGWSLPACLVLAAVTAVSSSGIVAKLLEDLGRLGNRETPAILGLLVAEDLAMAALLPVLSVLVAARPLGEALATVAVVVPAGVLSVMFTVRFGHRLSRLLAHTSDEAVLLSVLGIVLVVGGLAERVHVSAGVGAFLVGIALSDPVADHARRLVRPLRDLFGATFFFFFGLGLDPGRLIDVLAAAGALALAGVATKGATGWWAARRAGVGPRGAARAGAVLVARGEFSILLAQLAAGVEADLAPLVSAYVLLTAVAAPVLARVADPAVDRVLERAQSGAPHVARSAVSERRRSR